ncbi:hypothetical protein [Kocuria tytonicola]|nr:hypothetical protein [Kocuria tytonicola]
MDIKPVTRATVAKAFVGTVAYLVGLVLFLWHVNGPLSHPMMIAMASAVVVVLTLELRAFPERRRREDGIEMTIHGARCQGSTVVEAPASEIPPLVQRACEANPELDLTLNTVEGGRASTGIAFTSWGERLRFVVRPLSATRTAVTATCRPAFPLELTNWGRSERHLHRFLSGVQQAAATRSAALPRPMS